MESSLYGENVPDYLSNHGLNFAKASNIKFSNDFYITDFLNQAQIDLTFNITLSITEDMGIIETADATIEETEGISYINGVEVILEE